MISMEVYAHCRTSSPLHQHRSEGRLADNMWSHATLCGPTATGDTPVHPIGSAYAHPGFGFDRHGRHLDLGMDAKRLAFCLEDFARAKVKMESIFDQSCPFLCLHWGQYDQITLDAAAGAGYANALTLDRIRVNRRAKRSMPMCMGRLAVADHKSRFWLASRTLRLALGR